MRSRLTSGGECIERRHQAPTGSDTPVVSPEVQGVKVRGTGACSGAAQTRDPGFWVMGASFKDGVVTSGPDSGDELTLIF